MQKEEAVFTNAAKETWTNPTEIDSNTSAI